MVLGIEVGKVLVSTCRVVMVERSEGWVSLESCLYNCPSEDKVDQLDRVGASVPMLLLD
jgi:hypothetical protein